MGKTEVQQVLTRLNNKNLLLLVIAVALPAAADEPSLPLSQDAEQALLRENRSTRKTTDYSN